MASTPTALTQAITPGTRDYDIRLGVTASPNLPTSRESDIRKNITNPPNAPASKVEDTTAPALGSDDLKNKKGSLPGDTSKPAKPGPSKGQKEVAALGEGLHKTAQYMMARQAQENAPYRSRLFGTMY